MVIVRDYKWFMRNSIADECPFDYVFPFSWNAVPIRENLLSNQILKQSLKRISKRISKRIKKVLKIFRKMCLEKIQQGYK
jgi:hypothetical protein